MGDSIGDSIGAQTNMEKHIGDISLVYGASKSTPW